MDEVDDTPYLVFVELRFESGHTGILPVSNATENFAVAGAVFPGLGRCKVGGVGDHVHSCFAIVAVASGAIAQEHAAALRDRLFRIGNGVLELLRLFGRELSVHERRHDE